MSGQWIVGTAIAAVGTFAAVVPLWRSRRDRRAHLTFARAGRVEGGALRISVANGGRGDAFHAEIAIVTPDNKKYACHASRSLGFIAAKSAESAEFRVAEYTAAEERGVFLFTWSDANDKRRTKISRRTVQETLRSTEVAAGIPAPRKGYAFVYDGASDNVLLGDFHADILKAAGLLELRNTLVLGYAREDQDVAFYRWPDGTLPDVESERITLLVRSAVERERRAEDR